MWGYKNFDYEISVIVLEGGDPICSYGSNNLARKVAR